MDLDTARTLLELGTIATRKDIKRAYRHACRRWHPDLAPAGEEALYRHRMQDINAAYQCIKTFLEDYRYILEAGPQTQDDYQHWWDTHFGPDLWATPSPRKPRR